MVLVVQQQLGACMRQDALLFVGSQPRIERDQDGTSGGDSEVGQQVLCVVVHQAADAIAGLHA